MGTISEPLEPESHQKKSLSLVRLSQDGLLLSLCWLAWCAHLSWPWPSGEWTLSRHRFQFNSPQPIGHALWASLCKLECLLHSKGQGLGYPGHRCPPWTSQLWQVGGVIWSTAHSPGAMGKAFCKIDETVGGTNIALLGFKSWFYLIGVHPWANDWNFCLLVFLSI